MTEGEKTPSKGGETPASPPEVVSGKRARKSTDFYKPQETEKLEFVIKPGKGKKLGDIPNVHFLLGKVKADDDLLVQLHQLLYKRLGQANKRKRSVLEFSGFTEEAKELSKTQEKLGKWTSALLNHCLDVFELPRGAGDEGKKDAKVARIMAFLQEPKQISEKDLAAAAGKKKEAARKKRDKSSASKAAAKASTPKGGKVSASKKRKAESDEEDEPEDDEDEEQEEEAEEQAVEADKEEDKDGGKTETISRSARRSTRAAASPKAPPAKSTPKSAPKRQKKAKAEPEATPGGEADVAMAADAQAEAPEPGGNESSTGAPPPTDEELREAALSILSENNTDSISLNQLMKLLEDKFKVDMKPRRTFLKELAVQFTKQQEAAAEVAPEADVAMEDASEPAAPPDKEAAADEAAPVAAAIQSDAVVPAEPPTAADPPSDVTTAAVADATTAEEPAPGDPAIAPAEPIADESVVDASAAPAEAGPQTEVPDAVPTAEVLEGGGIQGDAGNDSVASGDAAACEAAAGDQA